MKVDEPFQITINWCFYNWLFVSVVSAPPLYQEQRYDAPIRTLRDALSSRGQTRELEGVLSFPSEHRERERERERQREREKSYLLHLHALWSSCPATSLLKIRPNLQCLIIYLPTSRLWAMEQGNCVALFNPHQQRWGRKGTLIYLIKQ